MAAVAKNASEGIDRQVVLMNSNQLHTNYEICAMETLPVNDIGGANREKYSGTPPLRHR
jgi:hypothetical protein